MATRQQKDKSPKRSPRKTVPPASDRSLRKRRDDIVEEDSQENCMMSLNVLAQVASATLEKEPPKQKKNSQQKKARRSMQSLELLDLDQIKQLSEKYLVSYFAELTSNEMTRYFTYTCHLMPTVCHEQFRSFGNEQQARIKVKKHLLKHLEQLTVEQNDSSNEGDFKFTAEPLHIRNRKQHHDTAAQTSRKKGRDTKGVTNTVYQRTSRPGFKSAKQVGTKYTGLKPGLDPSEENVEKENTDMSYLTLVEVKDSSVLDESVQEELRELNANREPRIMRTQAQRKAESRKQRSENGESISEATEQRIAENEQFIIDLLCRNQPHHDHSYTTMFGKKKGVGDIELENMEEDGVDLSEDLITKYRGQIIYQPKRTEPILCLGNVSVMDELSSSGPSADEASKTIIVCSEEIIDDNPDDDVDFVDGVVPSRDCSGSSKPYPPMPKYPLARFGRITDAELMEPQDEGEGAEIRKRMKSSETSEEWERKAALKLIRELKGKKKEEKQPLYCKLCKDKTFTAHATLIYHYRSHAGIKPFVCLICNTTFTRQHSLNYHMLIHNNQSRFTCKDCGRKFRHPSHFKEHLRRHTGETPFVCTDCPQRFKTRNTYKRHLKTRHGKLLTAAGIHVLSVEEFAKIRTKPYRRAKTKTKQKTKYTGMSSSDLPLPGKKLLSDDQDTGSGDSSTISVTGDLGELVDIKLEIDNALEMGEEDAGQSQTAVMKSLPAQHPEDITKESVEEDHKTAQQDVATASDAVSDAVLREVSTPGAVQNLVPYNYNLAVNS